MFHAQSSLYHLLSNCVLFSHEVSKCSQLGLVLVCYKDDDPVGFCQNLCISPHTFDFQNDSPLDQWPIPYQLAIALFWFGHSSSATSVDTVAQWAGCSTGTVINATQCVITAFLPLHYQAIQWPNVREHPSFNSVLTTPNHPWHILPQSQHETLDSVPKTIRTAVPKHCGKL